MLLDKIHHSREQGFTLIELMIVLTVVAILTVMAVPSFNTWILNGRIRASASGIADGLRLARAEALKRNKRVSFQLCGQGNSIAADKGLQGSNWVISLFPAIGDGANICAQTTIIGQDAGVDVAFDTSGSKKTGTGADMENNSPVIARQPAVNKDGVQVEGWSNGPFNWSVSFDGLGRVVPHPSNATLPENGFAFNVGPKGNPVPTAAPAGIRSFAVLVSTAGQIRVCDRLITDNADPRFCPN